MTYLMSSSTRATLAPPAPLGSPSFKSKRKTFARRCERCCCNCIIYFPLVFVYGLTSWAVWVQATVGLVPPNTAWTGRTAAIVGILLYVLLNWSYTTAVFTDPGSPLTQTTSAYSIVPSADEEDQPTQSPSNINQQLPSSLTVKSTGEARYCKKCQTAKPDRTHHCSTCRRCVLKMDHHCPWLATCVGFRNYKPFLLFLIYTSFFCLLCFVVSGNWVWQEVIGSVRLDESERLMPVNIIILAVMAGVIGLVLTGFTGWHVYLACTGQTTIESLEKTRYLAPLRKSLQLQRHQSQSGNSNPNHLPEPTNRHLGQSFASQLKEIHANAIPGVTRPEEGVSTSPGLHIQPNDQPPTPSFNTPAQHSLRKNISRSPAPLQYGPYRNTYSSPHDPMAEAEQERLRYHAYLDELDISKLPNAFDLGWRRNLRHVLGPRPEFWLLPICNTTGDGWSWEPSKRWLEAREEMTRERKARAREEEAFARERWETMGAAGRGFGWKGAPQHPPRPASSSGFDQRNIDGRYGHSDSSLDVDNGNDSDPSLEAGRTRSNRSHIPAWQNWGREAPTSNWNDIPDEFLDRPRSQAATGNPGDRSRLNSG